MATALELHNTGQARVIPILLRDCLWKGLPFSTLQLLPTDAKPIRNWQNKDSAWTDVARGVQSAIQEFRESSENSKPTMERAAMSSGIPRNNFFDVAAAGNTTVAAEDEPRFAVESVKLCERIMRTISYRENDWWHDEAGQMYLVEQQLFLERKGRIERVFIIPENDEQYSLSSLADSLDQQSRLGIEVFYVLEQDIPAGYFEWVQDFILYDDKLLRVSTTVPPDGLLGRPAQLYTDSDMLRRGLQWFSGLKALSTPWAVAE